MLKQKYTALELKQNFLKIEAEYFRGILKDPQKHVELRAIGSRATKEMELCEFYPNLFHTPLKDLKFFLRYLGKSIFDFDKYISKNHQRSLEEMENIIQDRILIKKHTAYNPAVTLDEIYREVLYYAIFDLKKKNSDFGVNLTSFRREALEVKAQWDIFIYDYLPYLGKDPAKIGKIMEQYTFNISDIIFYLKYKHIEIEDFRAMFGEKYALISQQKHYRGELLERMAGARRMEIYQEAEEAALIDVLVWMSQENAVSGRFVYNRYI